MNSRYRKIKKFLQRENFEGFTKKICSSRTLYLRDESEWHPGPILRRARRIYRLLDWLSYIALLGRLTLLGSDMLATSIILASETQNQKYI